MDMNYMIFNVPQGGYISTSVEGVEVHYLSTFVTIHKTNHPPVFILWSVFKQVIDMLLKRHINHDAPYNNLESCIAMELLIFRTYNQPKSDPLWSDEITLS
jgi:hypothetical protein